MRCPFEIGEEIVCIETVSHTKSWERDGNVYVRETLLTCGEHYIVTTIDGKAYDNIGVKGDHGFKFQPNWSKFVSLKEYRKIKLEKLSHE